MRNYNETDKILKDKLEQYDSGAPMHLFGRIEEGLGTAPESKKRAGMWWWTFGLLLMLVVGGTSWYIVSNQNQSIELANETVLSTPSSNEIETIPSATVTTTTIKDTELSTAINKISAKDLTTKKAIADKSNELENKIINYTNSEKTTPKNIIPKVSQNHFKNENHQIISEEQAVSKTTQYPTNTLFSKGKISNDSPQPMAVNSERESILTAKKLDKAFGQKVPSLVNLKVKHNSKFDLPDIVKCGNKKDSKFDWNFTTSMDFFVSPERSFRFLEYKSEDFATYAARRNETEKPYYSFSSGFRFNLLADNGLAVRTGLVYSQINEIFEDQFIVQEILINPISGDTLGFTQYLNDVTTFNRYKMVDVPLLIGYEIPMKRSTINVNAGVYVNVSATQKGTLLDVEETKRNFTTGSGDYQIFRKNIGLSYFMSVGAAYEISPRYQFFFEPNLRFYPGSFTKKEFVLNQKYVTGGIIFGIRKKL